MLATKRLEEGSFRWPSLRDGVMRLDASAIVGALAGGLDWARVRGVRTLATLEGGFVIADNMWKRLIL